MSNTARHPARSLRRAALALAGACGLLIGCGQDAAAPITTEISLVDRLGTGYAVGEVALGTAGAADLMGEGWHTSAEPASEAAWTWTSSERATLLVPVKDASASEVVLEARAPSFLPYAFSVGLELNGEDLGTFPMDKGPAELRAELPAGLLRRGLNRLTLVSSHVEAPADHGKGGDTRPLGVQVRRVAIGGEAGAGASTRIKVPSGGQLAGSVSGELIVQDAETLAPMSVAEGGAGPFAIDLAEEEGREVYVSTFGDVAELSMGGTWRPANLVLIIVDTLRADVIDQVDTPHLDALAAEGVRFEKSFSHAPMTLPSHTALFSSRYPHVSGIVNNGQKVPRDLPLLSDWMRRSGYEARAVASLGTLWLGSPNISLDRGFETFEHARGDDAIGSESVPLMEDVIDSFSPNEPFFLFAHFADPHEPYRDSTPSPAQATVTLNGEPFATFEPRDGPHINGQRELPAGTHRFVIDGAGTELKLRTLHVWKDGPWRGWVPVTFEEGALNQPADKLVATFTLEDDETLDFEIWVADKPERGEIPGRYRQEVERADAAVGEVIAKLKERGLWDSSLVIFTSDHGEALGEGGRIGHVQTLYDDQIHVPLIIKAPKDSFGDFQEALAERREDVVRHIDIVPTVLDILGLAPLPDQLGTSLLEDKARLVLSETHKPEANRDSYAARNDELKLIFYPEANVFELFDMQADPAEKRNVFAQRGDEVTDWQELLRGIASNWTQFGKIEVDASETARLEAMGYL